MDWSSGDLCRYADLRPVITVYPNRLRYGSDFFVSFMVPGGLGKRGGLVVECRVNSAPFVTHSFAQGQRQLKLQTLLFGGGRRTKTVLVTAPPNSFVAPSQYYMLFIVVNGIPGKAHWVRITP